MPNYRRAGVPGGSYFFTVVTHNRQPLLTTESFRCALREAINEVRKSQPFENDAWVLLPDHMHCMWTLPEGDQDFSKRWGRSKAGVSKRVILPSIEANARRESGLWQRRFWEHLIRDERDFRNHLDYIHFNPVKHGMVSKVTDWPYSSFHRYARAGIYPEEWACDGVNDTVNGGE